MKNVWKRFFCLVLAVAMLALLPTRTAKADSGDIEDFVTRLYTLCLNRTPDAVGLEDWCTQLSSGSSTGTKVAHGFVFSNEFTSAGYSDEEFVQLMYRIFLGREADSTGLNDWLNRMRNQGYGREAVFNGFSQSQEFNSICTEYGIVRGNAVGKVSDDISSFVIRLYQVCLGRDADATGLDYWASQLKGKTVSAAEVAYGFVFSPEFLNKNYDDATFVKYMYQAFLDRTADSVGLADWTANLQNGSTREDVFYGFVGSNEFADICEDYGITPNGQLPEDELQIGYYMSFGAYEQDNNTENGKEKIDWLVVDKVDGKVLMVSKYALDAKVYNDELVEVTWEECTLRNWLNNEFYNEAFDETEKAAIVLTKVQNEDNEAYGVEGGNDTEDNIFLLSRKECYSYLNEEQKLAELTAYAKAQGGYYDDRFGGASWWLRSPGIVGLCASAAVEYVGETGKFIQIHEDYGVNYENPCVRPALWMELQ